MKSVTDEYAKVHCVHAKLSIWSQHIFKHQHYRFYSLVVCETSAVLLLFTPPLV